MERKYQICLVSSDDRYRPDYGRWKYVRRWFERLQPAGKASSTTAPLSIQTAAMVIAVLPIMCVYPFLQKYFVTGMMVGSVKE